jgi:hypothetical protein
MQMMKYKDSYMEMSDHAKRLSQLVALREYIELGFAEEMDDEEIRGFMLFELHRFEEDEHYEACALLRDVIELYDKEGSKPLLRE